MGRPVCACQWRRPIDSRHYRQFVLELIAYNEMAREVQVRQYVSRPLTQEECQKPDLDLEANREVDTNFQVGLFDFPMIDNTRLIRQRAQRGVVDRAESECGEHHARVLPCIARQL
jgi:hypothetical protein